MTHPPGITVAGIIKSLGKSHMTAKCLKHLICIQLLFKVFLKIQQYWILLPFKRYSVFHKNIYQRIFRAVELESNYMQNNRADLKK